MGSTYAFRMMFAIWDDDTGMKPTDLENIGSFEVSIEQTKFFQLNDTVSENKTPLKFHICDKNEIY